MMTREARALAQALLQHHKRVCRRALGSVPPVESCVMTYHDLCARAGIPELKNGIGAFMREIALWCYRNGWPPLNALAVNRATQMPGRGYDRAPGCSLANWRTEVIACINFSGYPDTVEND
jgi:hypothetical protein